MCDLLLCYKSSICTVRVSITDPGMTLVHSSTACLRSGRYTFFWWLLFEQSVISSKVTIQVFVHPNRNWNCLFSFIPSAISMNIQTSAFQLEPISISPSFCYWTLFQFRGYNIYIQTEHYVLCANKLFSRNSVLVIGWQFSCEFYRIVIDMYSELCVWQLGS